MLKKYSLFCVTEDATVQTDYRDAIPTVCPHNNQHEIDVESIAVVAQTAELDTNIKSVAINLPSQEKAFPDFSGYPYFADSMYGVALAGQQSCFYLSFNKLVRLQGGGFRVGKTAVFGDYMVADMTYGIGGPVVGSFVNKMYVWPERVWEIKTPDSQAIPIGICLRMTYVSVGAENVEVIGWYDMRRTPSA